MKRNILFKTLIDILFIFQGLGFFGALIVIPFFGVVKINPANLLVEKWTVFSWVLLILSLIIYTLFMLGIFYLRKVARHLLSQRYFTTAVILNLKKSGRCLIYSGVTGCVLFALSWFIKLNLGNLTLYNSDIILPLFILIVGLFFIIQSEVLFSAKNFKEENDLTI